jgi:hypothetical protein
MLVGYCQGSAWAWRVPGSGSWYLADSVQLPERTMAMAVRLSNGGKICSTVKVRLQPDDSKDIPRQS